MASYHGKRSGDSTEVQNNNVNKGDFVDISSKSAVSKVYNKKYKVMRIVSLVLAILFTFSGGALCYASSLMASVGDDG